MTARLATAIALAAIFTTACQNAEPLSPPPPAGPTAEIPPAAEASAAPAAEPPAAPPQQWTMPNLVGTNLQQAQDQIQSLTGNPLFLTLSHDATGQSRNQVVDSNWTICTQNISPGTPITGDTAIDFGAVKLTEACP